jgi:phage head maturation protease
MAMDVRESAPGSDTLELSFSSESTEVTRTVNHDGDPDPKGMPVPEILSHADGAVDVAPFMNVGAILFCHDHKLICGVPVGVRVDSQARKAYATVRFGSTAFAKEKLQEVRDGTLRGVSVGFNPLTERFIPAGETSPEGHVGPCILITKWTVHEASLTPVPADSTVGVGRTLTTACAVQNEGRTRMNKKLIRQLCRAAGLGEEATEAIVKAGGTREQVVAAIREEGAKPEGADKFKTCAKMFKSALEMLETLEESGGSTQEPDGDGDGKPVKEEKPIEKEGDENPDKVVGKKSADKLANRSAALDRRQAAISIRECVSVAGLDPELADEWIADGVTLETLGRRVAKALKALNTTVVARDAAGVTVVADAADKHDREAVVNLQRTMPAVFELSAEEQKIEKRHVTLRGLVRGFLASRGVRDVDNMTPKDMFVRALQMRGIGGPAGNTSGSLSNVLANIQNKAMLKGYRRAAPTWSKIGSRVRLSDTPELKPTGENGEIHEGQITDTGETIQLATYGTILSFTWQMFINDDLDALSTIPMRMGQAGARLPSRLMYTHLLANPTMADGYAFFDNTYHYNIRGSTLSASALELAVQALREMKPEKAPNDEGYSPDVLDLEPQGILVPPALEWTASKLIQSPADVNATYSAGVVNPLKGVVKEWTVEARLGAAAAYTGYSDTVWFLYANPNDVDIAEVAFLDGMDQPQTDSYEDFDRLAVRYRMFHPVAVKMLDWHGMIRSA